MKNSKLLVSCIFKSQTKSSKYKEKKKLEGQKFTMMILIVLTFWLMQSKAKGS